MTVRGPLRTMPALTALLAAAGLVLCSAWLARRAERRQATVEQLAARTASDVSSALVDLSRVVGKRAVRAARERALRWALDNDVDGLTLNDLLATEEWWQPYRDGPSVVARGGQLWASHGTGAERLLDRTLLAQAQKAQPALAWLAGPTAAAAISVGARRDHVLVVGQPLDRPALTAMAASLDLALLVSDGVGERLYAGRPGHRLWLAEAIGGEAHGPRVSRDGRMLATPVSVTGSWWIWAGSDAAVGIATPPWLTTACLLVGLGALAGAGVILVRRRGARTERASPGNRPTQDSPEPFAVAPSTPGDRHHDNPDPEAWTPSGFVSTESPRDLDAAERVSDSPDGDLRPGGNPPVRLPLASRCLGRYTLLDQIGEGGMSDVFTATLSGAQGFKRLFVIKQLKPQFAGNRESVDQFIDEAKLGALLVHSNIVPVLDFGKVDGGYYLAQEYIAGRTIAALSRRYRERVGACQSPAVVCYIAYEVLSALAYAHERADHQGQPLRIVHRDVSCGNVMATAEGEVKLLDFGIVRADLRVASTEVGHVKGNASFMAPEQARGGDVDARADLFSLGMVMYYALTGEPLYRALHPAAVFHQAINGPTSYQLARLQLLPEPMGPILERALASDPDKRYPTARAFADAVVPHLAGAKSELAMSMNALFGDELRRETASFRAMLTATVHDVQIG
jgi:eukaryotic-like serine/threonine-protein kinase